MPTTLPNNLKKLRDARGWSLATLANKVGCLAGTIDKLEKGRTKLTVEWAQKIAPYLGVHWSQLFDDSMALSPREEALLGMLRGLPPEEHDRFLKLADATAHALAEPSSGKQSNDG